MEILNTEQIEQINGGYLTGYHDCTQIPPGLFIEINEWIEMCERSHMYL